MGVDEMFTRVRPLGFIRTVMLIGLAIMLASVFYYVWAIKYAPNAGEYFSIYEAGRENAVSWLALVREKELYRAAGYNIDFMDGPAMTGIKGKYRHWGIIFEIFALRFYGLFLTLPVFCMALLFGGIEGFIANKEHTALFKNISSTRFHVATLVAFVMFSLAFLFLCLPFGSEFPGTGIVLPLTAQIGTSEIWLTSPRTWSLLLAPVFFW